ncbi:MAG: chemotaxis protein CheW [Chromatiales bacterium]|jgi:chemosensory pili system protein ChpC
MNAEQRSVGLRALLLPLRETSLLLPQNVVADISFHYEKARDRQGKPDWFHGDLYWHGNNVPVISYEKLNGQAYIPGHHKEKIAICNLLDASGNYPAVGILVRAVPRMVQVDEGILLTEESAVKDSFALANVRFQGESMIIPDIQKIGREINRIL